MKSRIIQHLGQTDILVPSLIADGLAANDRVKLRFTALQAAAVHARNPSEAPVDLSTECRAGGIDPAGIQSLIAGARMTTNGRFAAPNLDGVSEAVVDDIETMVTAVEARAPNEGKAARERVAAFRAQDLFAPVGEIPLDRVARLTGVSASGDDTPHRLVMDLHKV